MRKIIGKFFVIVFMAVLVLSTASLAVTDTTSPVITANPSGGTVSVGATVKITINDPESKIVSASYDCSGIYQKISRQHANTWTINLTNFNIPGKTYEVVVVAENEMGLETERTFIYYVEAEEEEDTTDPVITSNVSTGSTILVGDTVKITIKDNESKIVSASYDCNGITSVHNATPSKTWVINLKAFNLARTYEVEVTAENEAGLTVTESFTFYAENEEEEDTTEPVITASPASDSTVEMGEIVKITINDPESKIVSASYDCNGITQTVNKASANTWVINLNAFNMAKTYEVEVTAENEVGLEASETFVYYVETEEDETNPTVTADPDSGAIEALENIELTLKDNEALKSVRYNWNSSSATTKNLLGTVQYVDVKAPATAGTNRLYVTVTDASGNTTSRIYTYNVVVEEEEKDTSKPVITADLKSGSTIYVEDNEEVIVKINDPESKIISASYDLEGIYQLVKDQAAHTWYIKVKGFNRVKTFDLVIEAENEDGLTETKTFTYYVKTREVKDETNPTVSANPSSGTIEALAKIEVTAKDNEALKTLRYNWNNGTETIKTISGTTSTNNVVAPSVSGTHHLYVTVVDANGNDVSKTFTYYIAPEEVVDNVAPTISVNPANKSTVAGGRVIKATLRDDVELAKVQYNWKGDGVTTRTLSGTYSVVNLPAIDTRAGTYHVYITVVDASGNETSGVYTYYVEDDDDDCGDIPEVDADPSKGTLEYGDRITITAEDNDGIDYVEYYWDDEDDKVKKYDDEFTVKVPSETGKHYLYVRATDEKGNRCDYERFVYTIEENNYPGNPDIDGELNKKVRELRVEIRNGDDKIKFEPQEEILYYVDYYNGSSSKVNNAKIIVDLPSYLEGIKASDDGKITSTKITWNLGTLDKGEYGRVSFTAQYTTDRYNEKIITVPAKIYSGSTLRDTSTVRNLIYCDDGSGTGSHEAYCIGYPEGDFRPNANITRAELATMIANIEGISSSSTRSYFRDVDGHWAAGNIEACVSRGYMKSTGYNTFDPERYATRAELAYAIAAILGVEDLEPIFVYSSDLKNSDARCAMEQLLRLGIIDGYRDGTSRPNNNIIRSEAVVIINNYLFRGELYTNGYRYSYNYDVNYNYGGSNYILKFTDLPMSHWAYGHIMEATNDHRYVRVLDGNEEML